MSLPNSDHHPDEPLSTSNSDYDYFEDPFQDPISHDDATSSSSEPAPSPQNTEASPQSTEASTPAIFGHGAPGAVGNTFGMNTPVSYDGAADGVGKPRAAPPLPVNESSCHNTPASSASPTSSGTPNKPGNNKPIRPPITRARNFAPESSRNEPRSKTPVKPVMSGALVSSPGSGNSKASKPPGQGTINKKTRSLKGWIKGEAEDQTASVHTNSEDINTPARQRLIKGPDSRLRTWIRDIRRMGRRRE